MLHTQRPTTIQAETLPVARSISLTPSLPLYLAILVLGLGADSHAVQPSHLVIATSNGKALQMLRDRFSLWLVSGVFLTMHHEIVMLVTLFYCGKPTRKQCVPDALSNSYNVGSFSPTYTHHEHRAVATVLQSRSQPNFGYSPARARNPFHSA